MRPASLAERGFTLPDDRSPVSLLRAVRDFLAPDRAHYPIEGYNVVFGEDDAPRNVFGTIESEAAVINTGAIDTGYRPVGVLASIRKNFARRASYALRHTDTSPDSRRAVAAWFGFPECVIWPDPIAAADAPKVNASAIPSLAAAGFTLPAEKPLVGNHAADAADGWRKWNLVRAIATWLEPAANMADFYDRRVFWLNAVCFHAPQPAAMRKAFNAMKMARSSREIIAAWIGCDVLAIWPDHRARRDGNLPAASVREAPGRA